MGLDLRKKNFIGNLNYRKKYFIFKEKKIFELAQNLLLGILAKINLLHKREREDF